MNSGAAAIEEAFHEAQIKSIPDLAFEQMAAYLELLSQWNARLSLTAIRNPSEIIRRHLVESALLAQWLPQDVNNLMDYGSGAGFPGLVVAICRPAVKVLLAEAHGKKASFLREVARTVVLKNCEIYEGRVETMPSSRTFDVVSMRAVEKMDLAIQVALGHIGQMLVLLTTDTALAGYKAKFTEVEWDVKLRLPGSEHGILASAVPRGTVVSHS